MKTKILATIIANLFAGAAFAQSTPDATFNSSVDFGLRGSNVSSEGNKAKFNEYRDMRDGVIGTLDYNKKIDERSSVNVWIENPGRDDQFWRLKGQTLGMMKYSAYYNEIVHNLSLGAKTFYGGVGSTTLTYPSTLVTPTVAAVYTPAANVRNSNAWGTSFDYTNKRKDMGFGFDWSTQSPWYFSVNANQESRDGLKRVSSPSGVCIDKVANCTSAFGNIVEMPQPIDWKTTTASGEIGYNTRPVLMSLKYTVSSFKNYKENLSWQNPYVTSQVLMETTTGAPESTYGNLALQGAFRELPMGSAVTYRGNYAKFTNNLSLLQNLAVPSNTGGAAIAPAYGTAQVLRGTNNFRGNIVYRSASLAWTATPTRELDTRLYFNWNDKSNTSTELTYTGSAGTTANNERFQYKKNDLGFDLGYRVRKDAKLMAGYEYTSLNRTRPDYDKTVDQRIYGEAKYSGWEWGTGRIKYQRLARRSHFVEGNAGTSSAVAAWMDRYIARYDANSNDQNTLRMVLDTNPTALTEFGVEYIFKDNNYKPGYANPILGRQKDRRNELYFTAGWGKADGVRLSAYLDFETVKYDSYHRNPRVAAIAGAYDPNTAPSSNTTGTGWNWAQTLKDRNWSVGMGLEWPIKEALKFVGAMRYEQTDGSMDFASQTNAAGVPFGSDTRIASWDTYKKTWLNLKLVYKQNKRTDWNFGFIHERLRYQDGQFDSYANVVTSAASGEPSAYLTGFANKPNYTANMVYATAKYSF